MKNMEKILVRKVRSSCFSVILVMLSCGCCSAALLTRMSILPNSRAAFWTAFLQNFSRPNSPRKNQALPARALTKPFFFPAIGVPVKKNEPDIPPLFAKKHSNGPPNPPLPAGDQRDFLAQFPAAGVMMGSRARLRPHFVLATRLFSLVLGRAKFLLPLHTEDTFLAPSYFSPAHLRPHGTAMEKTPKTR